MDAALAAVPGPWRKRAPAPVAASAAPREACDRARGGAGSGTAAADAAVEDDDADDADLAALVSRLRAPPSRYMPNVTTPEELVRGTDAVYVYVPRPLPPGATPDLGPDPARPDAWLARLTRALRDEDTVVMRALRFSSDDQLELERTLAPLLDAAAGVVEVLDLCLAFSFDTAVSNPHDALSFSDSEARMLAPLIAKCTKLRHLDLSFNPLGVEGVMAIMPALESGCTRLVHLNLSHTELGQSLYGGERRLVIKHGGLRRLDLSRNNLDPRSVAALASDLACPNLQVLDLSFNEDVGAEGLAALAPALAKCTHFRELRLPEIVHGVAEACAMALILASCPKLRALDLPDAKMGSKGAKALAADLAKCAELERLGLANNQLRAAGLLALSPALARCTNLKELDLGFNHTGEGGSNSDFDSFLKGHEDKLEWLSLQYNELGTQAARALAPGLGKCARLRELDLYFNNIGNDGAAALAPALAACVSLQSLNLGYCDIEVAGVKALSAVLSKCAKLSKLALAHNAMGPEGAAALASGLAAATALRYLDVSTCQLRDQGARHLASLLAVLPGLEFLSMFRNSITDEGARALAEQLAKRGALSARITLNVESNTVWEGGVLALASVLPRLHPDSVVKLSLAPGLKTLWTRAVEGAPHRRGVLALIGGGVVRGRGRRARRGDGDAALGDEDDESSAACAFVRSDGDTAVMRRVLGMLVGGGP